MKLSSKPTINILQVLLKRQFQKLIVSVYHLVLPNLSRMSFLVFFIMLALNLIIMTMLLMALKSSTQSLQWCLLHLPLDKLTNSDLILEKLKKLLSKFSLILMFYLNTMPLTFQQKQRVSIKKHSKVKLSLKMYGLDTPQEEMNGYSKALT